MLGLFFKSKACNKAGEEPTASPPHPCFAVGKHFSSFAMYLCCKTCLHVCGLVDYLHSDSQTAKPLLVTSGLAACWLW